VQTQYITTKHFVLHPPYWWGHNTSQLSNLLTLKAIIKQVTLYYTHHTGGVTDIAE